MDAATLHCPTCGAAATSDATQCAYCKARLATVACPSCFGMLFAGTRFCPHCGAHASRADAGDVTAAERPCPRCKVALHAVSVGDVQVRECGSCAGLWVDAEAFTEITAERERQAAVLASLGGSGAPATAPVADPVRYGPCPQCGKLMNRVNFARYSGVVVDVCKGHGTWFDADELRRVIEFIRSGGLEMAREKERIVREEELRHLQFMQANAGVPLAHDEGAYSGSRYTGGPSSASLLRDVMVDGIAAPLWAVIRALIGR
jgi:Zn-finger nucleic acid-binding protein